MKKALLAAALAFVLAFGLVGCIDSSAKSSPSKSTTSSAQSPQSSSSKSGSNSSSSSYKKIQSEFEWGRSISSSSQPINPMLHSQVGVTGWFYGYVYDVYYAEGSSGQPTFIDFGSTDGKITYNFAGIIWGENRANFPDDLKSRLKGKMVAVYGTTYEYTPKTRMPERQIELTSPDQIRVYPN